MCCMGNLGMHHGVSGSVIEELSKRDLRSICCEVLHGGE